MEIIYFHEYSILYSGSQNLYLHPTRQTVGHGCLNLVSARVITLIAARK